jgi:hypothetical protein
LPVLTINGCPATFRGRWCLNLLKDTVYLEIMKCVGKMAIWLAVMLVSSAGAQTKNVAVASADNPYALIAARNIFCLNPAPTNDFVGDPPPKITLTGIMSAMGNLQALYKVAGTGKPGDPAKDQSYILSEGQREDDIEVVEINDKANLVTFNNHGTVQEIPLANAPKSALSGPGGPGGPVSGRPGLPGPRGRRNGGEGGYEPGNNYSSGGGAGRPNRGMGNNANQNPNMSAAGGGPVTGGGLTLQSMQSAQTAGRIYVPQQNMPDLSPEETAAYIEVQRQAYQNDPNPLNQRMANLLPPTKFSPPAAAGP